MTKVRIGIIFIVASVALALDQLLRFNCWEWNQIPTLWHHEGIALVACISGVVLIFMSRRAHQKD